MVAARRPCLTSATGQGAPPDLASLLSERACTPDDDLRRLLMALRRGYMLQVRAIDEYLGLPPARSARAGHGEGRR